MTPDEEACSVCCIDWLSQIVSRILRRLGVTTGDPQNDSDLPPDLRGGDRKTGEELRRFFLELLDETNLRDYHAGRGDYIGRRTYLNGQARELLQQAEDPLREIERHILAITGSGRAKPLWVVSPPY